MKLILKVMRVGKVLDINHRYLKVNNSLKILNKIGGFSRKSGISLKRINKKHYAIIKTKGLSIGKNQCIFTKRSVDGNEVKKIDTLMMKLF